MKRTRRNSRVACDIEGRMLCRHGYVKGTIHNLSTGGLFFAGKRLSVEEQTEMSFVIDGQTVQAVVEVLYRKPRGEDAGVGVRFLRLGAGAVGRINAYLLAGEPQ